MRCISLWCVYKTLSGLCFEAKQIHSAPEFHHKIWKKNSFAWKTRTRKASPYNIKVWIIVVWLFFIIGEFGQEINNFRSSNTEQEAYISFLSSSFAAFTYILETIFGFSSAYISHGYTYLPVPVPVLVPEEGWFGQPKYSTHKKDPSTSCRLLLLFSTLTYNSSEEPLVMLLWLFSRLCCTLLFILSSHHSA